MDGKRKPRPKVYMSMYANRKLARLSTRAKLRNEALETSAIRNKQLDAEGKDSIQEEKGRTLNKRHHSTSRLLKQY